MKIVYVSGAAAVSAFGFGWRALGDAVRAGSISLAPSLQLAATLGVVMAAEVPAIPLEIDVDARARKLMSHPARLAAVALRLALIEAAWPQPVRDEIGFYLGVGASGCAMDELNRMLAESIADGQFSLERFGGAGLAACNPLFAFQLMNNFTLCHGAILNGPGGPNGAFYSRGTGTLAALSEAHWLIASGQSQRALAGGADSALHAVTWSQLVRDGWVARGLVPGEGAALLALSDCADGALARLERTAHHSERAVQKGAQQLLDDMLHEVGAGDLLVLAPWGDGARAQLQRSVEGKGATVLDTSVCLGDSLAAAPALAWCVALDLLRSGAWRRAYVLNWGIDGGIGLAVFGSVP